MASSFTFSKQEKLCGKKNIEKVFQGKKVLHLFPFSIYYHFCEQTEKVPLQIAFGVSKKLYKKAVDRNRIKRLMREVFRLNKGEFAYPKIDKQIAMIVIYHAKKIVGFLEMEKKWKEAMLEFKKGL